MTRVFPCFFATTRDFAVLDPFDVRGIFRVSRAARGGPSQGTDWGTGGGAGRKEPNRVGVHYRADGIGRLVGPVGKLPVG